MDEQLLREARRIKPTNNSNVCDQLLDSYQMMSKEELMNRLAKIEMNQTQMLPSTGTAPQREVEVSIGSGFGSVPVPDSKSKMQKENKRRRLSNETSRLYDSLTRFDNNYTGTRSGLGKSELKLGETPTLVRATKPQRSSTNKKRRASQSLEPPKENDSSVSEKPQEWQGNLENCPEQTEDVEGSFNFSQNKSLNEKQVCDARENKSKPKTPDQAPPKSPNRKRALVEHAEQKQTAAPKPEKQAIRQPFTESPPKERSPSPTSSLDVYSLSAYSVRGAPTLNRRSPRQPITPPLTHKQKATLISEWAQEQRERCSSGDFEEDKNVSGLQRNVRQVMAGCKRRHDLKLIGY